jgi:ketopantoate reductase
VHVSVFGAGALGAVYGVRLAARTSTTVSFVVRPARVAESHPIVIESVRKEKRERIDDPIRVAKVPEDADVILLAVGTEDLDAIRAPIGDSEAPIVVLTPMLPKDWARVKEAFGERVLSAMPSVVAYARKDDGVVRYWLPPTPTRIDEPRGNAVNAEAVRALTKELDEAGLKSRLELGVHEKNPATTVCFIAIGMAVSIAKSAGALAEDEALATLTASACREGVRLAYRIGSPEAWAVLSPSLAAPWAMHAWIGALRKLSPEGLFYFEEHFGRKLREQHRVMAKEIIALLEEKLLPHEAWDVLARRLDA